MVMNWCTQGPLHSPKRRFKILLPDVADNGDTTLCPRSEEEYNDVIQVQLEARSSRIKEQAARDKMAHTFSYLGEGDEEHAAEFLRVVTLISRFQAQIRKK